MPARRSGLGRGLDALIPSNPPDSPADDDGERASAGSAVLRQVRIDEIHPNRYQPRQSFAASELDDLTASIRTLGVLQPLLVRPAVGGGYELIAGERRWRAARAAGLDVVPAVVRSVEDHTSLEQALVENLQRSDLNPLEEAVAFQQLLEEFSLTQEAVATRVGRSRSAVANTLRLLNLAPPVQELVRSGGLSAGHARAVLAIDDVVAQETLARLAADESWSVRQVEQAVRDHVDATALDRSDPDGQAGGDPSATPTAGSDRAGPKSAALLELEHLLADHLSTRVQVQMAGGGHRVAKGRIIVEFSGLDDLERIYRTMVPVSTELDDDG